MLSHATEQRAVLAITLFGAGALCAWFLPHAFMGVFGATLLLTTTYFLIKGKGEMA